MPAKLSQAELQRFLAGRRVAVLVTIGADGRPLPTPIWYAYRDGLFYFRTAIDAVKTRNVQRDPRVSVCVQDERPPYRAVIVHATAEVREPLAWLADVLPRRYLGAIGAIRLSGDGGGGGAGRTSGRCDRGAAGARDKLRLLAGDAVVRAAVAGGEAGAAGVALA